MSTDLTKTSTNLPATPNDDSSEEIISSDIKIPGIYLMQKMSKWVEEEKAKPGEFVQSKTMEIVGSDKEPLEFIPLTFKRWWVVKEKINKRWEYRSKEPLTAANQDLPWEFTHGGTEWQRVKNLFVYAVLPRDLLGHEAELAKLANGEMPDPNKALFPVMIPFRSSSYPAGQAIVDHFMKAKMFKQAGHVSVLKLSASKQTKDDNTFFVYAVTNSRATKDVSANALESCAYWRNILATQNVIVEDPEDSPGRDEAGPELAAGSSF